MTREQYFKNVKVIRGNHYCIFCDSEADFVIINEIGSKYEFPMCKKCAEFFKSKINSGLEI